MILVDDFIDDFNDFNNHQIKKAKDKMKKIKEGSEKSDIYNNDIQADNQDGLCTTIFFFDEIDLI